MTLIKTDNQLIIIHKLTRDPFFFFDKRNITSDQADFQSL